MNRLAGWALATLSACSMAPSVEARTEVAPENQPPSVEVMLRNTPHSEPITPFYDIYDPDGDPHEVTWTWTQNGQPTPFVRRSIPASATEVGDVWELAVHVTDGIATTTALAQTTVTNSAPEVIGARITPEPIRADSTLRFVYDDIEDAEDDRAVLTWSWWVDGVEQAVDGPLLASQTRGGESVVLRVTATDGIDQTTQELGPVVVPHPTVGVDLVIAVDITGSMHREFPGISVALRDLAARVRRVQGDADRIGLVTFAWKYGYEATPLFKPNLRGDDAEWAHLTHASRIRGSTPDLDDEGVRPHMPREYDGEQGTDPHVGLMMARKMLTEDAFEDRYRAILLVTDGEPLSVKRSEVREQIGYSEDRWRWVEGVDPHSSNAIAEATVAEAEQAWDQDRISVFVVSVRDAADFLERTRQGDGTYRVALRDEQVLTEFSAVVDALPWRGE